MSEDILLTWARANPDAGPAFLARVLLVLTAQKTDATERALHPLVMRLLNEFGDRDDILATEPAASRGFLLRYRSIAPKFWPPRNSGNGLNVTV